ncbi:uncharacterized protein VTP21DRAFT_1782 [Calcarisporiella thermophila]|uniref:uncharacterized protein n=1 Tax=Calcarisporiella thermophila TaxID=911321 RepID=UPI0037443B3B
MLPLVARLLAKSVLFPLGTLVHEKYVIFLAGILVTNLSFILAAICLYILTYEVFADRRIAFASALSFCVTPSCVFMSSMYSESLFALLSFAGMISFTKKYYIYASVAWGIASATRSNGILYVGFFIYEFIIRSLLAKEPFRKLLVGSALSTLLSMVVVSGFVLVQWQGYTLYCLKEKLRPWCDNRPPLIYSFVQRFYWDVGFLRVLCSL